MKKFKIVLLMMLGLNTSAYAGMEDDPLLVKFMLNEFEVSDGDSNPLSWNTQVWIGKDLNKLWIKSEGESVDGEIEENELQLLYSRAISPYWDAQIGLKQDNGEGTKQDWVVLGFEGLAPYYFEINSAIFIAESGQAALRLDAEYEMMITQRLVLSPEVEINIYAKEDLERGVGSGLSDITTGIRLRYEIRREFAPYIGVTWNNAFGGTADQIKAGGGEASSSALVIGLRAWF